MSLLNKASLIQIPSGYKDGTLYSAKPTNGDGDFTFSRGSNLAATRVNSDGLIEKGRENLVLYSQDFSQANWVKLAQGSGSAAIVTSGFTDPNGGSNAWRLQCNLNGGTTSTDQSLIYQGGALTGVFAFSYYVKSNTGSSQDFAFGNSLAGYENGTATTEWQRFTAFFNCTSNNNTFIGARGSIGTDDTLDILIYAAQLEAGLVATDYIETGASTAQAGILEDMPRLDYSGGASCGSLLLEPQRSNVIVQSEYLNTSYWTTGGTSILVTSNATTSPEGVINASKLVEGTATSFHRLQANITATAATHSYSVYLKAGERDYAYIFIYDTTTRAGAYFNLAEGTIGSVTSGVADIESVGNGWYRCIVTGTFASTSVRAFISISADGVNESYAGDGTSGIYAYGAQLEEGSYPTSYIPTYGASVTRGVDFSDNNDIVSNPISFGANDNFTLFYEGSFDDLSSTSNMIMGGGNKSVGNAYKNYWWVQNATSIRITGDSEVLMASATMSLTDNTNHKLLVKRDGSIIDFFVDGSKLTTTQSTPNTAFVFRSLGWSYTNSVYKVSGNIKQALIFNSALTDDECIQLTTL